MQNICIMQCIHVAFAADGGNDLYPLKDLTHFFQRA